MKRPCIKCGTPTNGTRCPRHQTPKPTRQQTQRRATVVQTHIQQHGHTCPGWNTPPHNSNDLTADHIKPKTRGGTETGQLQVLCRQCNSRKRNNHR